MLQKPQALFCWTKRRKNNSRKMRENPRRVQKDNGGPLQIKYKDTNINIDAIRDQNVFIIGPVSYWHPSSSLTPFLIFHLIDVTVAHIHKET